MRIVVLGTGYVGLVTGVGLSRAGHEVICIDKDAAKVANVENGKAPFHEPGLDEQLRAVRASGKLRAMTSLASALSGADVSIIAVGTPSHEGGIDLSQVRGAAREIGAEIRRMDRFHVVVVKSTVVPSTTDTVVRQELEAASGLKAGVDFGLAVNPEFLREGAAVMDFNNPDRIVIGADDERSSDILAQMYAQFTCPVIRTSTRNAEMIKYTSNALLAVLISFSNEVSSICEHVEGLDENSIMEGVHLDRRWWTEEATNGRSAVAATTYLRGGIGFGGSCFPKDVKALHHFAQQRGIHVPMLAATLEINAARAERIVGLVDKAIGGVSTRRIAILGLSFKPDTDDTRESPGVRIANALAARGAKIVVHDPVVDARTLGPQSADWTVASSAEEALAGADGGVITTAWAVYRDLDWMKIANKMSYPLIFDGRQVVPISPQFASLRVIRIGRVVSPRRDLQ